MPVVEDVFDGVVQKPLHGELDVDDVLVVSQHQCFLEHLVFFAAAITDLDGAHAGDVDQFMRLDRIGQSPAQTWVGTLLVAAKLEHDASLRGVDNVETAGQPDHHDQRQEQADAAAEEPVVELDRRTKVAAITALIAATTPLVENPRQLAIEVAP
ncbi:MAG: hypothetical protein CAPSK01_002480 [Candidatus Accumulibacter vicinus]|uniref:Uncharacterized protein n=1 Tax=Candidatus Accumulibacter vicinus TaxID=2954382 RepID=A0A084XZJ8_9PROT|nr:MAG: hypothetical protein CAPSK01_002480 [Candidatus Accumulibacter vicinus]